MRERLIQLVEFVTAIALTAVTLGSMFYLADKARHVAPRPVEEATVEPPASLPPEPMAAVQAAPEVQART